MTTHKPVTEADIAAALARVLRGTSYVPTDAIDDAAAILATRLFRALPEPEPTAREDGPAKPDPHTLWTQADGDRDEYLRLMREHGHLIAGKRPPGEDVFGHAAWRTPSIPTLDVDTLLYVRESIAGIIAVDRGHPFIDALPLIDEIIRLRFAALPEPEPTAREDGRTLADAVIAILERHRPHRHSMDPSSPDRGDAGAIFFELQMAYDGLARPASLELRAALDGLLTALTAEAEHEGVVRVLLRRLPEVAAARAALASSSATEGAS